MLNLLAKAGNRGKRLAAPLKAGEGGERRDAMVLDFW
jgi:hypothetical protein